MTVQIRVEQSWRRADGVTSEEDKDLSKMLLTEGDGEEAGINFSKLLVVVIMRRCRSSAKEWLRGILVPNS